MTTTTEPFADVPMPAGAVTVDEWVDLANRSRAHPLTRPLAIKGSANQPH